MKLKNPKSCKRCPAYTPSPERCDLGFKIEKIGSGEPRRFWNNYSVMQGIEVAIKPAEPCPKPGNNKELCSARRELG